MSGRCHCDDEGGKGPHGGTLKRRGQGRRRRVEQIRAAGLHRHFATDIDGSAAPSHSPFAISDEAKRIGAEWSTTCVVNHMQWLPRNSPAAMRSTSISRYRILTPGESAARRNSMGTAELIRKG
jgi:hypothetical protein